VTVTSRFAVPVTAAVKVVSGAVSRKTVAPLSRGLEQWRRDQVPDPADGQQVLGRELVAVP
jgi:hypothetical protein